jgi:uncharacterized protein Yka (UPF0111/DUF47 family)
MLRGLLPKEYAFYDVFEKLIDLNKSIGQEFINMVEGKNEIDPASHAIKQLERKADKTTRSCTDLLHRTFITPIDRDDIFDLTKALDGFADNINSASFRIANYGITEIRQDTIEFSKIIYSALIELESAVKGLRKIKQSDVIREKCQNVHELEDQADDILRKAVSNLFQQNDTMLLIKWKEIFERLEKAMDRLERAASIIETILIDNS